MIESYYWRGFMQDSKMIKNIFFKKGDTIILKGEKSSGIYYIKSGHARNIESDIIYGDNCEFRYFGFLGSLSNERTSTVIADSDGEALLIDFSIIDKNEYLDTAIHEVLRESVIIIRNKVEKIVELQKEIECLRNKK